MSVPNEDSDSESEDNEMDRLSETSGENQMNDDMEVEHETPVVSQPRAYIPGQSRPLMDDEELVMDKSAYRLFYDFKIESSSLSFDVLLDNLGAEREVELDGEPVCAYLVAGTQAARGIDNSLVVMRLSNMRPFHKKPEKAEDEEDSDSDDSSSSSSDEDLDSQPELEAASIKHTGVVNRVRAHQHAGRYLAAAWSDNGQVSIWDLTRPLTAVNDSAVMSEYVRSNESPAPVFTFKGHRTEGFALDWSPHPNSAGVLASGDCNGRIHCWSPAPSGWSVSKKPYTGHTESVEDIQWSSTEPTVFISVSADRSFRVWDTRCPGKSMLAVPEAHPSDINVASWNKLQPVSFLTGGDDGSLRVWDLRLVHKRYGAGDHSSTIPAYTHIYDYHSKPITSVEWHPFDAGVFTATSEDDQTTLWDTTLEQAEEPQEEGASGDDEVANLPVQLLFIHTGQKEVKEAHWHPQIPGLLLTTSLDGFNVFRTRNI